MGNPGAEATQIPRAGVRALGGLRPKALSKRQSPVQNHYFVMTKLRIAVQRLSRSHYRNIPVDETLARVQAPLRERTFFESTAAEKFADN